MAEVIGTVSAVIGIAQVTVDLSVKFVRLVKDYVEADLRVQTIVNDAKTTHAILTEFEDLLKESQRNRAMAALNTSGRTFQLVLHGIENCKEVFRRLRKELERVVGMLESNTRRISLTFAQKKSWLFRASDVRNIQQELSSAQQTILLGVSLTQMSLQLRAPGVPLLQSDESRLQIIIKSVFQDVMKGSPPPYNTSMPTTGGGGTSGGGSKDMSGQSMDSSDRQRCERVKKFLVSTKQLDAAGIRWLNDPFEDDMVTIYKDFTPDEYLTYVRQLQSASLRSSVRKEAESEARSKVEPVTYENIIPVLSEQDLDPYSDVVYDLIDDWKMSSSLEEPCGYEMQPRELVCYCKTCGKDKRTVMCYPCFKETNHEGHVTYTRRAEDHERSYCDCGDRSAWKRKVTCHHPRTAS